MIEEIGDTGNSRGPHLRFECRRCGTVANPATLGLFRLPEGKPERVLNPEQTKAFLRLKLNDEPDAD